MSITAIMTALMTAILAMNTASRFRPRAYV
jgi:hypothetical protein